MIGTKASLDIMQPFAVTQTPAIGPKMDGPHSLPEGSGDLAKQLFMTEADA